MGWASRKGRKGRDVEFASIPECQCLNQADRREQSAISALPFAPFASFA